jgi:hypothetical protein
MSDLQPDNPVLAFEIVASLLALVSDPAACATRWCTRGLARPDLAK